MPLHAGFKVTIVAPACRCVSVVASPHTPLEGKNAVVEAVRLSAGMCVVEKLAGRPAALVYDRWAGQAAQRACCAPGHIP